MRVTVNATNAVKTVEKRLVTVEPFRATVAVESIRRFIVSTGRAYSLNGPSFLALS